jgi:superfamily II DNA helicase RecQ
LKLQYAAFLLPLHAGSSEQDEMNRFLRGHRIVQIRKELVESQGVCNWAILAEYLDSPEKGAGDSAKGKIDYKEVLSAGDFTLFSKLREIRKKLAEDNGLPVYAVCTNEQLAEIAKRRPKSLADCMKIDGIGQSKAGKFFPALLECINSEGDENPGALF